jgi:outer membrane immunogenic protein
MRRLALAFLSTSALVGFGQAASAADLRVPAPVYKAAPTAVAAYNWTGWYAGGNIGYSWGRAESDFGLPDSTITVGGTAGTVDIPGFALSDSVKLKGVIGGGQFGYNWQTAPNWVFGLETDFQGSGEKGSLARSDPFTFAFTCGTDACTATGTSATDYTAKIKWFGTVRGRVGYAWDRLLVYGTGGLAYGKVDVSGSNTTSIVVTSGVGGTCEGTCFVGTFPTPFSASKIRAGWTLGGGIEGAAWDPRWTWKVEYLYIDLGKLQVSALTPAGVPLVIDTKFTDNIVRFGLNYRFGDVGKGPMVARY